MNKKDKTQGQRAPLTQAEIKQLSHMKPGQTINLRGMTLTCHASQPCLSGENCTLCALHHINCRGVACMKGMTCHPNSPTPARSQDVCFIITI